MVTKERKERDGNKKRPFNEVKITKLMISLVDREDEGVEISLLMIENERGRDAGKDTKG